jgi:hypothetical protein
MNYGIGECFSYYIKPLLTKPNRYPRLPHLNTWPTSHSHTAIHSHREIIHLQPNHQQPIYNLLFDTRHRSLCVPSDPWHVCTRHHFLDYLCYQACHMGRYCRADILGNAARNRRLYRRCSGYFELLARRVSEVLARGGVSERVCEWWWPETAAFVWK